MGIPRCSRMGQTTSPHCAGTFGTLAFVDLRPFYQTALAAAEAAAVIQMASYGKALDISSKSSDSDLVTEVDKACEAKIREIILSTYPDHAILGEEEGSKGGGRFQWIVDPLDGTVNYAHAFPFFCVSIALEIDNQTVVGVVLDPTRPECFSAIRGEGAWLNTQPIQVSNITQLGGRAMLATGFPYDVEGGLHNLKVFQRFLALGLPVRRPGAAALDLCYVACGRLDGFWEFKLHAWDCAAGNLIIAEAGGMVSNAQGGDYQYNQRPIVASNGLLHGQMLDVING
jgi:myo-inositol-1(or 4)-monophosphatase